MTQSAVIKREIVYRRPVEVVDSAYPSPLRSVSESIGVAVLVMFLLGSTGLLDWANGLPAGTTIGDLLSSLAQWWNDAMTYLHLAGFAEFLRQAWQAFQNLR
jgi:hypothetical protein